MTLKRSCFSRIAGAYFDSEGYVEEEVYSFMIAVICSVSGNYEPGEPESGFIFPAFRDRSSDEQRIEVFQNGGDSILKIFG